MTKYKDARKDIKPTGRKTPYDLKVEGTFAEKKPRPKGSPRPPTALETRANNGAGAEFGRIVSDVTRWLPAFEEDLRSMNEGKRGRPYEYPDLLIFWILCYMTHFGMTFRGAVGI